MASKKLNIEQYIEDFEAAARYRSPEFRRYEKIVAEFRVNYPDLDTDPDLVDEKTVTNYRRALARLDELAAIQQAQLALADQHILKSVEIENKMGTNVSIADFMMMFAYLGNMVREFVPESKHEAIIGKLHQARAQFLERNPAALVKARRAVNERQAELELDA